MENQMKKKKINRWQQSKIEYQPSHR